MKLRLFLEKSQVSYKFFRFSQAIEAPIRHFNPLCKGRYPGSQGVRKGGS